jgi:hypothetical protein
MEGVQAAMTTRNFNPYQWRNREEWRLISGREQQPFSALIVAETCYALVCGLFKDVASSSG